MHILIIDTDVHAAQVTSAVMSRPLPAATVVIASSYESAMHNMQVQRPDIFIIDPSPHSLDGSRLIEHFKAACPEAIVVVVAGAPTPGLRRRMQDLGVNIYLEKPALLPLLWQELHTLLQDNTRLIPADSVSNAGL
jgi:DNA-binding NarL/FixJ family response regulator